MEKCCRADIAFQLMDRMKMEGVAPNVHIFNSAISACARCGLWKKGLELFEEMEKVGVSRDVVSFNAVLDAVSSQVQLGRRLFELGIEKGFYARVSRLGTQWLELDLHFLSLGGGEIALGWWFEECLVPYLMNTSKLAAVKSIDIVTGYGKTRMRGVRHGDDGMRKRVRGMLNFMKIQEVDQPNKGRIHIDKEALIREVQKNGGKIVFDHEGYCKFKEEQTTANHVPDVPQNVRPRYSGPPNRLAASRDRRSSSYQQDGYNRRESYNNPRRDSSYSPRGSSDQNGKQDGFGSAGHRGSVTGNNDNNHNRQGSYDNDHNRRGNYDSNNGRGSHDKNRNTENNRQSSYDNNQNRRGSYDNNNSRGSHDNDRNTENNGQSSYGASERSSNGNSSNRRGSYENTRNSDYGNNSNQSHHRPSDRSNQEDSQRHHYDARRASQQNDSAQGPNRSYNGNQHPNHGRRTSDIADNGGRQGRPEQLQQERNQDSPSRRSNYHEDRSGTRSGQERPSHRPSSSQNGTQNQDNGNRRYDTTSQHGAYQNDKYGNHNQRNQHGGSRPDRSNSFQESTEYSVGYNNEQRRSSQLKGDHGRGEERRSADCNANARRNSQMNDQNGSDGRRAGQFNDSNGRRSNQNTDPHADRRSSQVNDSYPDRRNSQTTKFNARNDNRRGSQGNNDLNVRETGEFRSHDDDTDRRASHSTNGDRRDSSVGEKRSLDGGERPAPKRRGYDIDASRSSATSARGFSTS